MQSTLVLCVAMLSLFPMIKFSKQFYLTWADLETGHWERWGSPSFAQFYFGMIIFYFPVVFGKECENLNNDLLVCARNKLLYANITFWLILLFQQFISL